MRASMSIVLLLAAAMTVPAWAGGDSGHTPPNGAPAPATVTGVQAASPNYMDSCGKTIQMARNNLSKASVANKPKVEQWIAKATASQASGDGERCVNQAHQALTYEH